MSVEFWIGIQTDCEVEAAKMELVDRLEREGKVLIPLDDNISSGYYQIMIKGFRDKATEKVYNGRFSKKLPHNIQRIAERKLIMLHRSVALNDLRIPPSNRLEALKGARKGQYSIRINNQWRICFEWRDDGVYEVEIADYH
jgi:proteic killer suppression protein